MELCQESWGGPAHLLESLFARNIPSPTAGALTVAHVVDLGVGKKWAVGLGSSKRRPGRSVREGEDSFTDTI